MGKRELIVEAALTVVAEQGLSGFTQPRVSERAGLRQSHLTYYFPTRDDLLIAVAEEAVRRRIASFEAIGDVSKPAAKVSVLVEILMDPAQTRVLLALVQSADTHPQIRTAFAGLSAGLLPAGSDLLDAFHLEVSPVNLALLRALGTGLAVQSLADGADSSAQAKDLLLRFLMHEHVTSSSGVAATARPSTRKAAPRGPRKARS